ncbi:putative E3 ubiquitin-protein ligase LIN-2 [Rosa chinensis]|uniref:putative E3 ubiquitin-protein ligase LIN-2 n=1 Tax=Rosa chinensis TaxID=74649 RepID=UPI000D08BBC2|nr:putative E3 ubiquitin-protein ligase LIN-2 [Rosa chinensis]XP_024198693.1 putative E3 ubiquitin-protein ligase LIN-2 [Rosa chinensis]XP_040361447.1 putative E3 ubiquitin-protein ligase LIN-2 [Rosa chinensis]
MASSLEDLLAEDGFKGKKLWARSRTCLRTETMPHHLSPDQPKRHSVSGDIIRTGRRRSDVNLNGTKGDVPTGDDIRGDLLRRDEVGGGSKKEVRKSRLGGLGSTSGWEARSLNSNLAERGNASVWEARSLKSNLSDRGHASVWKARSVKSNSSDRGHTSVWEAGSSKSNLSEDQPETEIVEVEDEEYKDIYSNELYRSEGRNGKYSTGSMEKEGFDERLRKLNEEDRRHSNSSTNHVSGRVSFSEVNRKSRKQRASSHERLKRGSSISKTSEYSRSQKRDKVLHPASKPALDEIAIKAMVSILSGYIKRFIKEEEFRIALRNNCMSSLNFNDQEEEHAESKVIINLEEAMETIAMAAEESANEKDLRRASLQLSVITGLTSDDLKDGFTSGVSNCRLSACAHLYLSVVYKILKKDRVSAKHLLQVFCDSPFTARTILLPELWDYLFLPHLSHLKVWYDQEADSLADAHNGPRKLKLLGKVYNDILDSGTYQFAVYYKDWLTEGIESPSIPSIHIPSLSLRQVQPGGSHGHSSEIASPGGPQSMVSKKLYDAVFGRASKTELYEVEDDGEIESFEDCMRTPDGSVVVEQKRPYSGEAAQYGYRDIEEDSTQTVLEDEFLVENGLSMAPEQQWSCFGDIDPPESDLNDQFGEISRENTETSKMLHQPAPKEKELTPKGITKSISTVSNSSQASITSSIINPVKASSSSEELHGSYVEEGIDLSSIPQDFLCPLSGELFEDPVTLETGQTFERSAIRAWFDEGNRTCPVTGKALESLAVPLTNLILKRVICSWKSEHSRQLLAYASHVVGTSGRVGSKHYDETIIFVLEQLLTCFSKKERTANARHLISLGCLQFLLQRFEVGKEEEKSRVAALFACCIKADADCRNLIASSINKQCLVELLQGKEVNIRTNAVLLMTELICLKRKKDVSLFLTGLQNEGMVNTMAILHEHIQSSLPNQRPLAAVLLFYLDILVSIKPQEYSIHRSEAVDALAECLDCSLTDVNVRENCCKALLILGMHFSISGKLLSEKWITEEANPNGNGEVNSVDNEDGSLASDTYPLDDEENLTEYWLRYLTITLLGYGKKSILEVLSKCLWSEHSDLVRMCLITAEWLSRALTSLSDSEFQLLAFSSLIPPLKENLKNSEHVEHKILASMSLLNFSKISECRVLLMESTEDISIPLQNLAEVTWSAKVLYAIISGHNL